YKDGKYTALCFNPTQSSVRYTFRSANGTVGSALIPASGLVTCDPTTTTDVFAEYVRYSDVQPADFSQGSGVTVNGDGVAFANGTATYYIACGDTEQYRRIRLSGSLSGATLTVGGKAYALHAANGDLVTDPFIATFNQTVTVSAAGGTLTGIAFEELTLKKVNIEGATAWASSTNNENAPNAPVADKMLDGIDDNEHRWESVHGIDDVEVIITLPHSVELWQLGISWEAASAKEYKVYVSQSESGNGFTEVAHVLSSVGGNRVDSVTPSVIMQARRIKIQCIGRATDYGYSIMEVYCYNFG
ncbi:MAG: discoidin domain-containing protein, partial [Clostridiales bacterium]|nr:discoidin domain-containing protein [Clostridiales bacterium]